MQRKFTRQVNIGGILVGGSAPISVQSMTNTKTRDVKATAEQIRNLAEAGCDMIRIAIPDRAAAESVFLIKEAVGNIPII